MLAVFHFSTVRISRFARVALAFVLVLALCSGCVLQPASAVSAGATVAVSGGAIGAGGIPALGAIGSLLTPTLGVIGAVLLGAGINAYVTDQSAAQGVTKTQFIESSLRNWVAERNISFDDVIGTIAEGIHVSPLGEIALSGAASLLIYQFGNWLFQDNAVVDVGSSAGDTIGSLQLPANYITYAVDGVFPEPVDGRSDPGALSGAYSAMCTSGNSWIYKGDNSVFFVCCIRAYSGNNPIYHIYAVSHSSGAFVGIRDGGSGRVVALQNSVVSSDNFVSYYIGLFGTEYQNLPLFNVNIPVFNGTIQQYLGAPSGSIALPSDDVFTGNEQDWLDNRDLLKSGDDSSVVISNAPDLLGGLADGLAAGSYNISVPDYLTSIADAYNHALTAEAAIPVTLTNTDTGVLVTQTVEIANPFEGVANTTGAVGDHTGSGGDLLDPAADVNGPDTVALLKHDLKDFFPFCIPWDVYRLIMLFHGTPRAPVYRVSWDAPYLDEPITFGIDLSQWDSVAETWRLCYKIAFMMGLVLESRKVIKI